MPQEEVSQEADDEMTGMAPVVGFANDELATEVAIAEAATQRLDELLEAAGALSSQAGATPLREADAEGVTKEESAADFGSPPSTLHSSLCNSPCILSRLDPHSLSPTARQRTNPCCLQRQRVFHTANPPAL